MEYRQREMVPLSISLTIMVVLDYIVEEKEIKHILSFENSKVLIAIMKDE